MFKDLQCKNRFCSKWSKASLWRNLLLLYINIGLAADTDHSFWAMSLGRGRWIKIDMNVFPSVFRICMKRLWFLHVSIYSLRILYSMFSSHSFPSLSSLFFFSLKKKWQEKKSLKAWSLVYVGRTFLNMRPALEYAWRPLCHSIQENSFLSPSNYQLEIAS